MFCFKIKPKITYRYKKAGDYAAAANAYKSENVRVSFNSEHVPGEFGYLEKYHYISPTPYGHHAAYGRQHSYYGGGYGKGYGGYGKGYGGRRYGKGYGGDRYDEGYGYDEDYDHDYDRGYGDEYEEDYQEDYGEQEYY